jgi:hypothetical protein
MPRTRIVQLHKPASWYRTSSALLAAARTLWPKARIGVQRNGKFFPTAFRGSMQLSPVFLLLSAFAVENALKGTKVKQIRRAGGFPKVSKPRKGLSDPMVVWGHDLPALAKSVGLKTDVIDDEMLHTLKRNIEWAGRYPGPSGTGDRFVPRHGTDDFQRIRSLIRRIRKL